MAARCLQVLSCALWTTVVGAVSFLRANLAARVRASAAPHFVRQTATAAQMLWEVLERLLASHHSPG